jgi:hypothetical protein
LVYKLLYNTILCNIILGHGYAIRGENFMLQPRHPRKSNPEPNRWIAAASAALLFVLSASVSASAATVVVVNFKPAGYVTIQLGVDNAAAGDKVQIRSGTLLNRLRSARTGPWKE